jgi:GcrA cell cycle regulator
MRASKAQGWVDPWTAERIGVLTKLWADGLSASQVAGELGAVIPSAAVIGKVHRLKLPERQTRTGMRPGRKPRAAAIRRRPPVDLFERKRSLDGALTPHLPPEPAPPPVPALHITLDGLERHHCRWPFGHGPFTFCGHHNGSEGPYCAYHTMTATARRP